MWIEEVGDGWKWTLLLLNSFHCSSLLWFLLNWKERVFLCVCVCYIIMDMGLYGRFIEIELGELLRDYETLHVRVWTEVYETSWVVPRLRIQKSFLWLVIATWETVGGWGLRLEPLVPATRGIIIKKTTSESWLSQEKKKKNSVCLSSFFWYIYNSPPISVSLLLLTFMGSRSMSYQRFIDFYCCDIYLRKWIVITLLSKF